MLKLYKYPISITQKSKVGNENKITRYNFQNIFIY